jgi:hypothetical protein
MVSWDDNGQLDNGMNQFIMEYPIDQDLLSVFIPASSILRATIMLGCGLIMDIQLLGP